MIIQFETKALKDLYLHGATTDSHTQYRLLFHSTPDETGIVVNALLFEISKHYE